MKQLPLIVEKYPADYDGYPFITLLEYNKQVYLTIVNNCTSDMITAYVLDLCNAENIPEKDIVEITRMWYETQRQNYPISIEFSKMNLTEKYSRILRSFNVEFVTRVVGTLPQYNFTKVKKVRRRRKRAISQSIRIDKRVKIPEGV